MQARLAASGCLLLRSSKSRESIRPTSPVGSKIRRENHTCKTLRPTTKTAPVELSSSESRREDRTYLTSTRPFPRRVSFSPILRPGPESSVQTLPARSQWNRSSAASGEHGAAGRGRPNKRHGGGRASFTEETLASTLPTPATSGTAGFGHYRDMT